MCLRRSEGFTLILRQAQEAFDKLRKPSTSSGSLRQAQEAFDKLRKHSTSSGSLRQAQEAFDKLKKQWLAKYF